MSRIAIINETVVDKGNFYFQVEVEISFRPSMYAPKGDGRIPAIPFEGYNVGKTDTFVCYVKGSIFGPSYLTGLVGLGGVPLASYGQAVVESGDIIVRELFTTP